MCMQELFPGTFKPTATHNFIRLLADKDLLTRCYTQNIDSLEREAGTPPGLIVAAHGKHPKRLVCRYTQACLYSHVGIKVKLYHVLTY